MHRRLITTVAAGAVLLVGTGLLLASCSGSGSDAAADNATGLDTRTVNAGEIDITIKPRQLDRDGVLFKITLDTHSAELSMDPAQAILEVANLSWPVVGWDGDAPGGHHREGDLRFEAAGAPTGTARLILNGFPEPVQVVWKLAE